MTAKALALPTRHDEAFRYADIAAIAPLWPIAQEVIALAPGEARAMTIVADGPGPVVRDIAITLGEGSAFDLHVLNTPLALGRIAVRVTLGRGARFRLGAAQIGGASQTLEIVTEVEHIEPDAASSQVIRSVLAGHATGSYLGRVVVAPGAVGTDGAQSVRAMLLDRTATANARPELEIHADDVRCAHGCAVGELDREGLFYLESRGIPPATARNLMLQAFLAEAFVGAVDEERLITAALSALEALA